MKSIALPGSGKSSKGSHPAEMAGRAYKKTMHESASITLGTPEGQLWHRESSSRVVPVQEENVCTAKRPQELQSSRVENNRPFAVQRSLSVATCQREPLQGLLTKIFLQIFSNIVQRLADCPRWQRHGRRCSLCRRLASSSPQRRYRRMHPSAAILWGPSTRDRCQRAASRRTRHRTHQVRRSR